MSLSSPAAACIFYDQRLSNPWLRTLRALALLLVGFGLGLMLRYNLFRCWDLVSGLTPAKPHQHAITVETALDGYAVWRAAAPSMVHGADGMAQSNQEGLLCSPVPSISTLKDLLIHAASKHKGARALGQRKLLKEHKQTRVVHGKEREWTLYEKRGFEWLTDSQTLEHVKCLSRGLLLLGLKSILSGRQRDSVCLFLDTCMEWQLMAHSCFHASLLVVTSYSTLGKKGLSHAQAQTKSQALFTHSTLFATVLESLPDCPSLQFIVYVGEPDMQQKGELQRALSAREHHDPLGEDRILHLDKLMKIGKCNKDLAIKDPNPDDVALIMYTSRATGTPKINAQTEIIPFNMTTDYVQRQQGVLLTHANFVASVAGYAADMDIFDPTIDTYLAYLPLAHVLEFTVEQLALYLGIPIGYGVQNRSKGNATSVGMCWNCSISCGGISELQPTIMAGVPEVFEGIRKAIENNVSRQGALQKYLFRSAFTLRKKLIESNVSLPLFDSFIFRRVRQELGGKLNYVASGAAPLSRNNQMFLRVGLGAQVVQGYALTETAGSGTLQSYDDTTFSNVGRPNLCCEIKLINVPEMGYTVQDEKGPAGEILIHGPNVSKGYLNLDEKTKQDFTNGWFFTGDIGRWIDGRLYIVDRKKNLVKLSSGEYIALEKLETFYKESALVENIMVSANTADDFLVAVVQVPQKSMHKSSEEIKEELKQELEKIAQNNNLSRAEHIERILIDTEPWTPENGLVTATAKLNRNELLKKFMDQLKGIQEPQ